MEKRFYRLAQYNVEKTFEECPEQRHAIVWMCSHPSFFVTRFILSPSKEEDYKPNLNYCLVLQEIAKGETDCFLSCENIFTDPDSESLRVIFTDGSVFELEPAGIIYDPKINNKPIIGFADRDQ